MLKFRLNFFLKVFGLKFFLFFFFLFLNVITFANEESIVTENEDSFKVEKVTCILNENENLYLEKNTCFERSKDKAFLFLMKFLNEGIDVSTKSIDKSLKSFDLKEEDDRIIYNFIFDKKIIKELISKKKNLFNLTGKDVITVRIYTNSLINSLFEKIYKVHKNIKYKEINSQYLEVEILNTSISEFKKFLNQNYIKYNDFDELFQTQEEKDSQIKKRNRFILEIF